METTRKDRRKPVVTAEVPTVASRRVDHRKRRHSAVDVDVEGASARGARSREDHHQHVPVEGVPHEPCACKSSKCLKLYCVCYRSGNVCGPRCKCKGCLNDDVNSTVRRTAVLDTLKRDASAFKPKMVAVALRDSARGCRCVNSKCLKAYCECFQAGALCTDACQCVGCENTGSSSERRAVMQAILSQKERKVAGKAAETHAYTATAAAAIPGAANRTISDAEIGDVCRKVQLAGAGVADPELAMAGAAVKLVSYLSSTFSK
eukprot:m.319689 g.319689  ORF g.319689 m.319689 type:complete len:262 (+) comp27588_c1_seq16:5377-6162(+)